jgi:L-serine dehydratase
MNIYDIIGPVMVGPSSSHTAGAVRIGLTARKLLKERPINASIAMHGSFAATYRGHGTDRALVAGILGMKPDDMRIPDSFMLASEEGLIFNFSKTDIKDAHPNTVLISLSGITGRHIDVQASSIGGGRIMINKLDGIDVNFNGESPTLVVHNMDTPGHVAMITDALFKSGINIAAMQLYRSERGGYAVMVLEVDQKIPAGTVQTIESYDGVLKVTYIDGGDENAI